MIRELIALEPDSRVWIYQADRQFSEEEVVAMRKKLHEFLEAWTSHSRELMVYGNIFHRRFLGLFVDESLAGTSGCSIDASVHFIKELEREFDTNFFDRMTYTYLEDEEVREVHHNALHKAYADEVITRETLFFDNLVKTKEEFLNSWVKPLYQSWMMKFV